jgi:hypothetical protein
MVNGVVVGAVVEVDRRESESKGCDVFYPFGLAPTGVDTYVLWCVDRGRHSRNKMCALIFDEMSIMPHINYDKYSDEFYGFATDTPDIKIVDHVLVFYFCGIFKKWQQPIYFSFSSSSTKSFVIVDVLKQWRTVNK